jgi:hypothetical protein
MNFTLQVSVHAGISGFFGKKTLSLFLLPTKDD